MLSSASSPSSRHGVELARVAAVFGAVQGTLIARFRLNSMPVTLGRLPGGP